MKVIFLDFDGVLNCSRHLANEDLDAWGTPAHEDSKLNKEAVVRLNSLVNSTNARIVVSSMWRFGRSRVELQEILTRNGFTGLVQDKTPWNKNKRGPQIREWLYGTTRRIDSFVIIDDVDNGQFAEFGRDRLVLTSSYDGGLQDKHVEQARAILERPWTR